MNKGFTLIELLVVIAVIGVLATTIISSLANARNRASDAQIVQIVRQMQTALEMYYLDNGEYPPTSTQATGSFLCNDDDSSIPSSLGTFSTSIDQELRDELEEYYPSLQDAPACLKISYYSLVPTNTQLLEWCGAGSYQAQQGYILGYSLSRQLPDYSEFIPPSDGNFWHCASHNLNT